MDELKKNNRVIPLMLCQALSIISKPSVNSNRSYSPEMLNLNEIFCPVSSWNLMDDLEKQ